MDNKIIFKKLKTELSEKTKNTRYFNFSFFEDYLKARKQHMENLKNEVDDSYTSGYVTLYHCYDEVYNSKFYNENSCAYCVFLELISPYFKRELI